LPDLDEWTTSLLTNQDLLEMDDHLVEKYQTSRDEQKITWYAESPSHAYYAEFNISDQPLTLTSKELSALEIPLAGHDIWQNRDVSLAADQVVEIASHDVYLLKV